MFEYLICLQIKVNFALLSCYRTGFLEFFRDLSTMTDNEIDDNEFFHQDFTTASKWEVFNSNLEELFHEVNVLFNFFIFSSSKLIFLFS